jgi:hypothetical protein
MPESLFGKKKKGEAGAEEERRRGEEGGGGKDERWRPPVEEPGSPRRRTPTSPSGLQVRPPEEGAPRVAAAKMEQCPKSSR